MLNSQGLSLKSQVNTLIHPQASPPSPFFLSRAQIWTASKVVLLQFKSHHVSFLLKSFPEAPLLKDQSPFSWPTNLLALAVLSPPWTSCCFPLDSSLLEHHPWDILCHSSDEPDQVGFVACMTMLMLLFLPHQSKYPFLHVSHFGYSVTPSSVHHHSLSRRPSHLWNTCCANLSTWPFSWRVHWKSNCSSV